MFLTMGVTLYSTRLVLNALGSVDYGIFNLVSGVIVMLSFLNTAMSISTQRYLSYNQGRKDLSKQQEVFSNSLFLHMAIGTFIVIILEIAGLFLFDGFLNIPADRISTAKSIYHFMSFTVLFTILAVPFNGVLSSNENMLWIAIVNIIQTLLKFAIALLLYIIAYDKLLIYGFLTAIIAVITFALFAVYCLKKYPECNLKGLFNPNISFLKDIGSFAGWNLFGSLCSLGRTQGLALILNLFFGTVVNAAYGIANQVGAQLLFFSNTMLKALNPQIMKSEGAGDRKRMLRLSMIASKFGLFLLSFFAIPVIFEMDSILKVWLGNVPEYTIIFCQLVLIASLTNQLTIGLQSALQATGKIKVYQILVGGILLLNLPIAYFLLKGGMEPYAVLISYVVIEFLACSLRLFVANKMANLNIKEYLNNVILKEIIPISTIILTCYLTTHFLDFNYRFLFTGICSAITFSLTIYGFGLLDQEKQMLKQLFQKLLIKSKIIAA